MEDDTTQLCDTTSRVEIIRKEEKTFVELPALACGEVRGVATAAVKESDSALDQVLLLGGLRQDVTRAS